MRFDPSDPPLFAPATGAAPFTRPRRWRAAEPQPPQSLLNYRPFPSWARLAAATAGGAEAAFFAGAGLALFDRILRSADDGVEPAYAGVLRQRLALKAAASCARLARRREDESALRDAAHLAPPGAPATPAGRIHSLFRLGSMRPLQLNAAALAWAVDLLEVRTGEATLAGLANAVQEVIGQAKSPLAAAAGASAAVLGWVDDRAANETEILALWLADLVLARRLGWAAPAPLLATAIAHPALRREGRRPRPSDSDWAESLARAYALAAPEAYALAGDLSRRAQRLLAAAPQLRARGAARVVALLLADDCVSPACAAKSARLSDRAARRLFDRLIALNVARELSGRPSFRLYGL